MEDEEGAGEDIGLGEASAGPLLLATLPLLGIVEAGVIDGGAVAGREAAGGGLGALRLVAGEAAWGRVPGPPPALRLGRSAAGPFCLLAVPVLLVPGSSAPATEGGWDHLGAPPDGRLGESLDLRWSAAAPVQLDTNLSVRAAHTKESSFYIPWA